MAFGLNAQAERGSHPISNLSTQTELIALERTRAFNSFSRADAGKKKSNTMDHPITHSLIHLLEY